MRYGIIGVLVLLVVTGCEMTISIRPNTTFGAFYTEYEYRGDSVVCDDRRTEFTYSITYPSSLNSFDVYLAGGSSQRIRSIHSEYLSTREREAGRYTRSFTVRNHVVPLANDLSTLRQMSESAALEDGFKRGRRETFRPTAITVEPRSPKVVGHTRLVIETDEANDQRLVSGPIPVLDYCG